MEKTFSPKAALEAAEFPFEAALEFLQDKGPMDRKTVRICKRGPNPVTIAKVKQRIKYWAAKAESRQAKAEAAAPPKAAVVNKPTVSAKNEKAPKTVVVEHFKGNFSAEEFEALPKEVQELERSLKGAHTIRAFHRAQLMPNLTNEQRAEHCRLIAEHTDTITDLQAKIDFFKTNGTTVTAPEETTEDGLPKDPAEVQRMLLNCRSRLSNAKRALKKSPDDEDKQKKLAEEETLKLQLETHLAKLQNEPVQG
jgi:hypothetical protein